MARVHGCCSLGHVRVSVGRSVLWCDVVDVRYLHDEVESAVDPSALVALMAMLQVVATS